MAEMCSSMIIGVHLPVIEWYGLMGSTVAIRRSSGSNGNLECLYLIERKRKTPSATSNAIAPATPPAMAGDSEDVDVLDTTAKSGLLNVYRRSQRKGSHFAVTVDTNLVGQSTVELSRR